MIQTSFIGGKSKIREKWMKGEIGLAKAFRSPALVFFWDEMELPNIYRPGSPVFAPGYKNSIPIDIALEFSTGEFTGNNDIEAGTAFAEAVISDRDIREVRDKFWPQSARTIIAHVYAGAFRRWMKHAKRRFNQKEFPSMTYLVKTMLSDLFQCRGNGMVKKYPGWWNVLGKSSQDLLESLVIANAATTSASIFAEINSFMAGIEKITRRECSSPIFCDLDGPIYVHAKSLGEKGIFLLTRALTVNHPEVGVFISEAQLWPPQLLGSVSEALKGSYANNVFCVLTSGGGLLGDMTRDVLAGDIIWGYSKDPSVKHLFSLMVNNTTGNESGLMVNLPYEEPATLPTDWHIIGFSRSSGWSSQVLSFPDDLFPQLTSHTDILGERGFSSREEQSTAGKITDFLMEIFGKKKDEEDLAEPQPESVIERHGRDGPSDGGWKENGNISDEEEYVTKRLMTEASLIEDMLINMLPLDDFPDTDTDEEEDDDEE